MQIDVATVLGRRESASVEFTRQINNFDDLRKTVCGMSNDLIGAGGGDILIGVNDDGTPCGADVGRGIGRARALMADNSSPPPEFVIDRLSWTVRLRGRS